MLVHIQGFSYNKESPRGIIPRRSSSTPQGAKYNAVTQDTSPSGKAEVCNQYLFGRAKTGSLGQVTTKKLTRKKNPDITRTHPDGRLIIPIIRHIGKAIGNAYFSRLSVIVLD